MGAEYDIGLQIWRKRLRIWRKADGRRMEAHNILTPSPSLLTLALFGIFGTKLICFTFCEALHPARAQEKVLSILTWERSRWFDGISGRFDCVGYIPRISHCRSQWFLPTCDPPSSPLTMEQSNLYASPLNILRLFILNIELSSVVTCPF